MKSDHLELVDIIDAQDRVLYQTSKFEAHQQGLLHRTVIGELIDSQAKWTLVKQSSNRQDAGQLVSPVGGHVHSGESPTDALMREAKEEVGINITNFQYIGKAVFNRQVLGRIENHLFILYEIYSDQTPILNHESVSWQTFTPKKLIKSLHSSPNYFGDAFHFIIDTFYPHLKNIQF